jgi:hypothetical protein
VLDRRSAVGQLVYEVDEGWSLGDSLIDDFVLVDMALVVDVVDRFDLILEEYDMLAVTKFSWIGEKFAGGRVCQ